MSNFDHKVPYNDLPLLPPKADIETKAILRKTISTASDAGCYQPARIISRNNKLEL
jgi:hypothetical protein